MNMTLTYYHINGEYILGFKMDIKVAQSTTIWLVYSERKEGQTYFWVFNYHPGHFGHFTFIKHFSYLPRAS